MSGYVLAVFDDSPDYINRFLMYFNNKKDLPFEIMGFTNSAALDEYLSGGMVDILLLSRDCYDRYQMEIIKESEEDTRTGLIKGPDSVKEIVILGEQQDMNAEPKVLDRFRSMRLLEKDLMSVIKDYAGRNDSKDSRRAEILGIYSFEAGSDPYVFAKKYTLEASDLRRTLYADLDTFSGLRLRMDLPKGESMSDLIFYYRSDPDMFRDRFSEAVFRCEPMDILTAPVCLKDLDEISSTGWTGFLRSAAAAGGYDRIFLNITDSCRDMTGLFSICSSIFLCGYELMDTDERGTVHQVISDLMSPAYARAHCFREYFESKGRSDIISRFRPAGKDPRYDFYRRDEKQTDQQHRHNKRSER